MLLANKLIEKIPDSKSVKQSKTITYQPETFENSNTVDMKSIITENPKTSHKVSQTIRQATKIGSNSPLYKDTKKSEFF